MSAKYPVQPKVLLADDDQAVREALGNMLESEGFDVIRAKDGHEALVKFCEHHTDIALLDLTMPVKGGAETSNWLRSIAPMLPLIIITARPDAHRLMLSTGAVLMTKPMQIPRLLRVIRELLARSQHAGRLTTGESGHRATQTSKPVTGKNSLSFGG